MTQEATWLTFGRDVLAGAGGDLPRSAMTDPLELAAIVLHARGAAPAQKVLMAARGFGSGTRFDESGALLVLGQVTIPGSLAVTVLVGDVVRSAFPIYCSGPIVADVLQAPLVESAGTIMVRDARVGVMRVPRAQLARCEIRLLRAEQIACGELNGRCVSFNEGVVNRMNVRAVRARRLELRELLVADYARITTLQATPDVAITLRSGRVGPLLAPLHEASRRITSASFAA